MSGDVQATDVAPNDALAMRLAVAYYTPLGWAIADGDDVDPDDLAECLKAMRPVVAEVALIAADRVAAARADAWAEGYLAGQHDVMRDAVRSNPYRRNYSPGSPASEATE